MSMLVRFSPEALTEADYEEVKRRVAEAGQWPPDGLEYHVCFGTEGQLRVSEIWSSTEQFEAFGKHLLPALQDVGVSMSRDPEFLDIHNQERF